MLTPREFAEQLEGFRWRDQHVPHHEAQLAAWLLQPWAPKGQVLTADRLLGIAEPERMTVEEATAVALEKQARRRGDSA